MGKKEGVGEAEGVGEESTGLDPLLSRSVFVHLIPNNSVCLDVRLIQLNVTCLARMRTLMREHSD